MGASTYPSRHWLRDGIYHGQPANASQGLFKLNCAVILAETDMNCSQVTRTKILPTYKSTTNVDVQLLIFVFFPLLISFSKEG